MELYGFGSWDLVSQYVETRTAEEVKEEYITRYLEGNIGKATWAEVQNCRPMPFEHTPDDRGPLSPEVTSRLPPLDITPEEALELRYMSYRDDYDQVRPDSFPYCTITQNGSESSVQNCTKECGTKHLR